MDLACVVLLVVVCPGVPLVRVRVPDLVLPARFEGGRMSQMVADDAACHQRTLL